ncbi:MAG TPA: allantoicase [Gemmatimonadales bacterium]|nr:allantoicase [Gemmatimonadales bacterium]
MSDFTTLVDLAAERYGGAAVAANDEFFGPKENLLRESDPVWREGEYTERGKWMDGWETRRRREVGHDWCIVRLGFAGIIRGVVVDTTHFRGNSPEHCSLEACDASPAAGADYLATGARWVPILTKTPLEGNARNLFPIGSDRRWTHVRLNIFPDGGVARLRVHGEVVPDWDRLLRAGGWIDLAAMENGGRIVAQSDAFFGSAFRMLQPGRATHMGDGWETRRRRGPGHDWAVVKLARRGVIRRIEVDTDHFRGNAPGACSLEACVDESDVPGEDARWLPLLAQTKLQPHARHGFERELSAAGEATHVRLNIFPDGGIARLRLLGSVANEP